MTISGTFRGWNDKCIFGYYIIAADCTPVTSISYRLCRRSIGMPLIIASFGLVRLCRICHDRRIFATGANQKCTGKRCHCRKYSRSCKPGPHVKRNNISSDEWMSLRLLHRRHVSQINATIDVQASEDALIIIMSPTEVHLLFT